MTAWFLSLCEEQTLYREAEDGGPAHARQAGAKQAAAPRADDHPVAQTGFWLQSVVQDYFNYHAAPESLGSLGVFRARVTRLWRRTLRDRSHPGRMTWTRMRQLAVHWIPQPRVLHPYPNPA